MKIFVFIAAMIALKEVRFLFSIYRLLLEIFAVKVKSCPKSRRILDVFGPPKF